MIRDPVEMPVNAEKAKRLHNLRANKGKEVTEILDEIEQMARKAKQIMGELSK